MPDIRAGRWHFRSPDGAERLLARLLSDENRASYVLALAEFYGEVTIPRFHTGDAAWGPYFGLIVRSDNVSSWTVIVQESFKMTPKEET